eukprot:TRINITY_DN102396_c0_g1_i1.p1 TRINITY_DN102396_c0_g1~~TRINITY_DN102396_c0_g1_i1.p1  ORF type:complete len:214 (-),score=33.54 TRINITY_DN102396_c0_g1_i1:83-724(-)
MVLNINLAGLHESNCWKKRVHQENKALRDRLFEDCGRNGERLVPTLELLPEEGGVPRPQEPRRFYRGPKERIQTPPQLAKGVYGYSVAAPTCKSYKPTLNSMMGLADGVARREIGGCADHHTTWWGEDRPEDGSERPRTGGSMLSLRSERLQTSQSLSRLGSADGRSLASASRRSGRSGSRSRLSTVASSVLSQEVKKAVQEELQKYLTQKVA